MENHQFSADSGCVYFFSLSLPFGDIDLNVSQDIMLILDFIPDFINWINEFKYANYLVKIMIMKHFLFNEINIVKNVFVHLTWNKYHVQVELSPIDMATVDISFATAKRFLKLNLLSYILYCARPWNVKQKKHNNRKSENAIAKALLLAACFFCPIHYSFIFAVTWEIFIGSFLSCSFLCTKN